MLIHHSPLFSFFFSPIILRFTYWLLTWQFLYAASYKLRNREGASPETAKIRTSFSEESALLYFSCIKGLKYEASLPSQLIKANLAVI